MARKPAQRVVRRVPRSLVGKRLGGIAELALELGVDYTRASSMIYRAPGNGAPGPIPEDVFPAMSMGRFYDLDKWSEWYSDRYVPEADEADAPVA